MDNNRWVQSKSFQFSFLALPLSLIQKIFSRSISSSLTIYTSEYSSDYPVLELIIWCYSRFTNTGGITVLFEIACNMRSKSLFIRLCESRSVEPRIKRFRLRDIKTIPNKTTPCGITTYSLETAFQKITHNVPDIFIFLSVTFPSKLRLQLILRLNIFYFKIVFISQNQKLMIHQKWNIPEKIENSRNHRHPIFA